MDDKQKQIEEMARVMCSNSKAFSCKACNWGAIPNCKEHETATKLYNAGCRKIPEGSVVLSKEEYNALLLEQKRLREMVDRIPCGYELKEKTRKETAREVFERVKDFFLNDCTIASDFNLFAEIDEIAKEFGVEAAE